MITCGIKLTGIKSWEQQPISCDHLNGPVEHDPPSQTGNWKRPSKWTHLSTMVHSHILITYYYNYYSIIIIPLISVFFLLCSDQDIWVQHWR